jgi:hypothetical protein
MAAISRIIALAGWGLLTSGLLSLGGCASTDHWTGTWVGEKQGLVDPSKEGDAIANTINKIELTINNDGSFTLVEMGIPMDGTVGREKQRAELHVKNRFGQPITNEIPQAKGQKDRWLEWQNDQTILYHDPDSFYPEPVTLSLKQD